MWIVILLLLVIGVPIIWGTYNVGQIDFLLEKKQLSSPYYCLGVSFIEIPREDDIIQQELCIGLYFINIVVIFYK